MNKKQKKKRNRILVALAIFVVFEAMEVAGVFDALPGGLWLEFGAFLIPYLIAGYDVLAKAWHGITHKQPFDENLLMSIATIGAFALVFFPEAEPHMAEGAAVMLFYQVGELFESYAVGKTRRNIADMMDIAPDFATIEEGGQLVQVDPASVAVGSAIVVKPGERVPLDGVVIEGSSQLDTSALTGESVPRVVEAGAQVASGCVNMTGVLNIQTTKAYGESTVQRILDLVENASEKKARTENFITRFARYYTPIVVGLALLIALASPLLLGQSWSSSVQAALVFLVVSCPCALVISVPLSFFGGIGAASRKGILVKGSSYLEALAQVDTVAFDKTGTLTSGTFTVVSIVPAPHFSPDFVLSYAAHAENYSNHPIAQSVRKKFGKAIDASKVAEAEEISGEGVKALVEGRAVLVGNATLLERAGVSAEEYASTGTVLYVAIDGVYAGCIVIADTLKDDAAETVSSLRNSGVKRIVMLTGDREEVAAEVAGQLGLSEYHAQCLPADKVAHVEGLLTQAGDRGKVAFVGDGINDAPVLMRADVGIAMGALGSDAAIEAADVVLMDDKPANIAKAIGIARKTMHIVRQNIVFAIGVKVLIMILALPFIGIANMWLAVFGDVGVACLAILNAMRTLRV